MQITASSSPPNSSHIHFTFYNSVQQKEGMAYISLCEEGYRMKLAKAFTADVISIFEEVFITIYKNVIH
jgi:hypothetical protein